MSQTAGEAVAAARPGAIVHQMTGLSEEHAGKPNLRKPDRFFATTNRLRSEGTDYLLAAAEATGVCHVVAQGAAIFNGTREGGWVKTEEDPLEVAGGTGAAAAKAIGHLEDMVVRAGGAVLRYGGLYGPGATDDQVKLVRKRKFPLVGGGTGYFSWVHLDDAASATVLAVEQQAKGVFNIVDDEPAPVSEWLPYLAACAGAKRPMRIPKWLARLLAGEMVVGMMAEGRGFSNARAKRELGWQPRYPSWRQGGPWFPEPLLTDPYEDPECSAELADSVSMAALLLLERLTPLERAVFVLREVFAFGFPEIAPTVGRSETACRQLAVRARRHMDAGRPPVRGGPQGARETGGSVLRRAHRRRRRRLAGAACR